MSEDPACTCQPVVMHSVDCQVISPHGVCEFCKEPKDVNGSCGCRWEGEPS